MTYIKKIWLDLRFLNKNDPYSNFVYGLTQKLIEETPEYFYNIYLDLSFANLKFPDNSKNIFPKAKYKSLREQTHLTKKIEKDNNDLVIFFTANKPIIFKKEYFVFIPDLANIHFPENTNIIKKYLDKIIFQNTIKNAKKIICFDKSLILELNDLFNLNTEKIFNISPFFIKENKKFEEIEKIEINLKTKYNIKWNYIIYNSWVWNHKNLSNLIKVFKLIKQNNIEINLVILDDESIKNLDFRKEVLENNLTDKIFFIWNIWEYEKNYFYKNTLWVIYPHLYSIFPFSLDKALNSNSNIIASDLKTTKNIFKDKIDYFNPNNYLDIYEKIIKLEKKENNYNEIFVRYNINKTLEDLKKIIK